MHRAVEAEQKMYFENNFSEELIKRSRKAQENLLMKALNILKTGGEMIYSTC